MPNSPSRVDWDEEDPEGDAADCYDLTYLIEPTGPTLIRWGFPFMCLPSPGKLIDKIIKPNTFLGKLTAPLAHPFDKKSYTTPLKDTKDLFVPKAAVAAQPVLLEGGGAYITDGQGPRYSPASAPVPRSPTLTLSSANSKGTGLNY